MHSINAMFVMGNDAINYSEKTFNNIVLKNISCQIDCTEFTDMYDIWLNSEDFSKFFSGLRYFSFDLSI